MVNEKIKENLETLIIPPIGIAVGGIVGTIDVLTTGLPLLSGYCELIALSASDFHHKAFEVSVGDIVKSHLGYLAGVAIPFGIKYHNEIYNFIEGVLK